MVKPEVLGSALVRPDAERVGRTLAKLTLADWALTGGMAVALQLPDAPRTLNDLDILVANKAAVSRSLASLFLVRHFHPNADPGKLAFQLVDSETRLRIDIFTAVGNTLKRTKFDRSGTLRLVACEDLACRALLSMLPITRGEPVQEKHWRALCRLVRAGQPKAFADAWADHRRSLREEFLPALRAVEASVERHPQLLTAETYSTDIVACCPKCAASMEFPLATADEVLAILGYC